MRLSRTLVITVVALVTAGVVAVGILPSAEAAPARLRKITVPEADRFTPAGTTIHVGDTVQWVNGDTDNHTVVSDDFFTSADNKGTDLDLIGTEENGGQPGTVQLKFAQPGMFFYYCRFHSHLDAYHQPVAPGPDGGIEGANGNFGTPMMGVITVLP